MEQSVNRPGESPEHAALKRLAVAWAQANGFTACALEVTLPRCRFRADAAAYRSLRKSADCTAIFECKQTKPDLRRNNCRSAIARPELEAIRERYFRLERLLRNHFPHLSVGDSLFPEWDVFDFGVIRHQRYAQLLRRMRALQKQLSMGTKFESITRYRCANFFFLVTPRALFCAEETPPGWGVLVVEGAVVTAAIRPMWHETTPQANRQLLRQIAAAGTRLLNKSLHLTWEEIMPHPAPSLFQSVCAQVDFSRSFPPVVADPEEREASARHRREFRRRK